MGDGDLLQLVAPDRVLEPRLEELERLGLCVLFGFEGGAFEDGDLRALLFLAALLALSVPEEGLGRDGSGHHLCGMLCVDVVVMVVCIGEVVVVGWLSVA